MVPWYYTILAAIIGAFFGMFLTAIVSVSEFDDRDVEKEGSNRGNHDSHRSV